VADQSASGAVADAAGDTGARGLDAQTGQSYGHEAHHGRPASWVAVSIIIVGFIIGGISLTVGPTWWLFWTGVAIVVIGGIFALSVRILDDWY
jgi:nitrate/nitrite transporter NarK